MLVGGDIPAHIVGNLIRQQADGTLYVAELEVVWYDGRARQTDWVQPWEVTPLEDDSSPLGFS